jgi:hypothetical protein
VESKDSGRRRALTEDRWLAAASNPLFPVVLRRWTRGNCGTRGGHGVAWVGLAHEMERDDGELARRLRRHGLCFVKG